MIYDDNQCCAVIHGDKRCPKQTINHASHCSDHIQTATKLYTNYKKICDTAYNLEIDKPISDINEKYNYLYECYIWFNRAFHARLKHRRYAFVPECYDEGHNKQFSFILARMNKCEEMLREIHKLNEEIRQDQYNDLQQEQEQLPVKENIMHTIPNIIEKKKTKRENNEKEETRLIEKYNQENMEYLEKRGKLNDVCFNIIISFLEEYDDDIDIFEITVLIHHLTLELYKLGYFEDNYTPEKCKDCNCGNYVSYDVRLACGCIFQNNTVPKYLNLMSDSTIKKFCEIMLFHKQKLLPVINDLIELYSYYQQELLVKHKVTIGWDKEDARLKLDICFDKEPEKVSRLMARMRMKKKDYFIKYGKEFVIDE